MMYNIARAKCIYFKFKCLPNNNFAKHRRIVARGARIQTRAYYYTLCISIRSPAGYHGYDHVWTDTIG